jgi:NTE family protein
MTKRASIGLALSGGGVRGLAHVGVLQLLEEAHIPVDYVVGTSMGGIVAVLYAAGVGVKRMKDVSGQAGILDFVTPCLNRQGLVGHGKLASFLAEILGRDDLTFADLRIPAAVTATDLETGELVVLQEGPLIPALLATSAFPLVFSPVRHAGRWLVDGGFINNLPVDLVREMGAGRVIGVNTPPTIEVSMESEGQTRTFPRALFSLVARPGDLKLPFLIAEGAMGSTIRLVNRQRLEHSPPDLLLEVPLPNTATFWPEHNDVVVAKGYEVARRARPALKRLRDRPPLSRRGRRWRNFQRRVRRAWHAYHRPPHALYP